MANRPNPVPTQVVSEDDLAYAQSWLEIARDQLSHTPDVAEGYVKVLGEDQVVFDTIEIQAALGLHIERVERMVNAKLRLEALKRRNTLMLLDLSSLAESLIVSHGNERFARRELHLIREGRMGTSLLINIIGSYGIRLDVSSAYSFAPGTFDQIVTDANPAAVGPDPSTVPVDPASDLAATAYGSGASDEAGKQARLRRERTNLHFSMGVMLNIAFGPDLQGEDVSNSYPIMRELYAWWDVNPNATNLEVFRKLRTICEAEVVATSDLIKNQEARLRQITRFVDLINSRQEEIEIQAIGQEFKRPEGMPDQQWTGFLRFVKLYSLPEMTYAQACDAAYSLMQARAKSADFNLTTRSGLINTDIGFFRLGGVVSDLGYRMVGVHPNIKIVGPRIPLEIEQAMSTADRSSSDPKDGQADAYPNTVQGLLAWINNRLKEPGISHPQSKILTYTQSVVRDFIDKHPEGEGQAPTASDNPTQEVEERRNVPFDLEFLQELIAEVTDPTVGNLAKLARGLIVMGDVTSSPINPDAREELDRLIAANKPAEDLERLRELRAYADRLMIDAAFRSHEAEGDHQGYFQIVQQLDREIHEAAAKVSDLAHPDAPTGV